MRCFLVDNSTETIANFRVNLIKYIQEQGHEVIVLAGDDDRREQIERLGVTFYCVKQDNRALNPFSMVQYMIKIRDILQQEKPDVVFTFQLKPNTFGVFAARKAGIKRVYSMVEGAGDVFINDTLKWKLIRWVACLLYRCAFSHAEKVFFLNSDDRQEFVSRKLVDPQKTEQIYGIGVDLERFAFAPIQQENIFLMVARLHREKGIFEYCECARKVKKMYPDARFLLLGAERDIKAEDLLAYPEVEYMGSVADVRPYLRGCSVLVLPSYREGLPMSVMEAEAIGRAVITSDCAGCRDTVEQGFNGLLVPVKDVDALVEKCVYFIENPQEAHRMGENSRVFAQQHFDQKKINAQILRVVE